MSDRPTCTPSRPAVALLRPRSQRARQWRSRWAWQWAAILALATLPGFAAACSSAQEGNRPPFDPESLPAISFLLPAPFPLNDSAGEFAREQSLRLFSAPVLDPGAIEALAARFEIRSREMMAERQAELSRVVCELEPAQRPAAVQSYEIQRQRQWNRWLNLQERYEDSLKYRLTRDLHPDDVAGQARLNTLLSSREAVRALQRERQQLVTESYEAQLQALADRAPGGPDDQQPCDAPLPRPRTDPSGDTGAAGRSAIAPGQPIEFLYLPYYLALYRFLSLLPPEQRSELLLALHSGKSSDN